MTRGNGMRRRERAKFKVVSNAGWHFSSLGGVQIIMEKIEAFAHDELNTPEFINKDEGFDKINNGIDLFGRNLK